ncbi:MAG: DUF3783 domain-containing protein [Deltaproteobacteria bacterium]|nr:DUF3783 domain-containing protein [Deltaproteobacteria bacterium]
MKHKGTFRKVPRSGKRMHGPRALLICGYPEGERGRFLEMLEAIGLGAVPMVFATYEDLDATVGDLLTSSDKAGLEAASPMQRAVVMSGFTQKELHTLMGAYREAGLPHQLWATLTPVSERWPLGTLLRELERESESLRGRPK